MDFVINKAVFITKVDYQGTFYNLIKLIEYVPVLFDLKVCENNLSIVR